MRLFSSPSLPIWTTALMLASGPITAAGQKPAGHEDEALEEIVVQSTRSGRRVQDEPIRVEVISQEEIDEKLMMTPGNIATLVAETGGVRVQVTSPAMGASNVRMQGMAGRYTQLLADGLPLYGGQSSSLGLMQIPPTDLGQVEVIKGAASALYGPSALGGIINLISRRPRDELQGELLFNATSRDGQDLTVYTASPINGSWHYSLTGGLHRQSHQDLDDDGWIDIPEYERATLRPRLYWKGEHGTTVFLTAAAMIEERKGGTLPGRDMPDGEPYPQTQDSQRFDAGLVARIPVAGSASIQLRASAMTQDHEHRFGSIVEPDRHDTYFTEATLAGTLGKTSLLGGVAFQADAYRSETFPDFDYTYKVPALFAQAEHDLRSDLMLAASARWDSHSDYGSQFSPRFSVLYRPGDWTVRASLGKGFYAPTPFVEETEAAGLSRLGSLSGLKKEQATTASLDLGYSFGPIETSVVLFASDIDDAIRLEDLPPELVTGSERVRLVNAMGAIRTRGAELLLRYRWEDIKVTGSYVHVDATESGESDGRRPVALTPRHTAGVVTMWEQHGVGRLGLEVYYTGRQQLENNPYRSTSRSYLEVGMLGEITVGKVSLFLNLENILGVRQTRHDPMLLPAQTTDGRWTVDAWEPTDGFVVNGGIRLRFGEN